MSISLGVYEFFSYILPGILYLYVFNEFLGLINSPKLDLSQLNNVTAIFLLGIAYLMGQVMNAVTTFFWRRLGKIESRLQNLPSQSLERLKRKFPSLKIDFGRDDWDFLLNRLRQDEPELASHLERFAALGLMLRNTAQALLSLSIIHIGFAVKTGNFYFLINAALLIFLGLFASRRGETFLRWFYNGVYSEGLRFGKNAQEVLLHNANSRAKNSTTRRKAS